MVEAPHPVMVGSWNAGPAALRAAAILAANSMDQQAPLLDALVEGIKLIEDDPDEMSVGYGGLPNEEGVVELDAAVMDGPRHKAGAVAGLRGVRHAAAVALEVLRRTDHALLVGEGALKFARQLGFQEEDLMTDKSRRAWLDWKASLSNKDAWIAPDEVASSFGNARWAGHHDNPTPGRPPETAPAPIHDNPGGAQRVPFTFGTVHISGRNERGDLAAVTSTSGLSYKIPGRAGDTPIVGSGLYVENDIGSAGCIGRGEATMHSCASYETVRLMEQGRTPTEAALEALRRLARLTREPRLLAAPGRPLFNVTIHAIRKDGLTGSAAIHTGYTHIVLDAAGLRTENSAALFPD